MKCEVSCLIVLAALAACSQKPGSNHSEPTRKELRASLDTLQPLYEEEPQRPSAKMDELFDDFFFNYASNPALQKARTCFPLHFNAFGTDLVIEANEWKHEDFFGDDDFYTVFYNNEEEMEQEEDDCRETADLQLANPQDSTIRTFHFDRQDGLWKLTRQTLARLTEDPLADFYFFYTRFATDSVFQREHVAHQLRFTTSDPDDDNNTIVGTLTPDQWFTFCPELPTGVLTNILYGQTYTDQTRVIMLKRGISNGMLDILTFTRRDDQWKLTAYEN